ncbi:MULTISPECIES: hypothetical protein [Mesorhizobium]|uniref:hypothetical protein n=1 Tax=Mesorhizobium australicum TaxID=536018 RepID=UPI0033396E91
MVDWNADIGGAWKAHVYAAGTRAHPIEFQNLDERDDLPQRHAEKLAASMRAMHGGEWRVTVDHEHGFALIVEDRSRAS